MSSPKTIQKTLIEQEHHIDLTQLLNTPKMHTPSILAQINNTEVEKLKVKDVIEIERAVLENENVWRSSCFTADKRAVVFFSQLSITISVIGLCMYQLVKHHDDCDSNQLYSGILSMVIGIYLPQPKIKK